MPINPRNGVQLLNFAGLQMVSLTHQKGFGRGRMKKLRVFGQKVCAERLSAEFSQPVLKIVKEILNCPKDT